VAETQSFCAEPWPEYSLLGRVQRGDGSWTAWSGNSLDEVAATGFKAWVNPKGSSPINGSNVSYETHQASPASRNASAQASVPSGISNAGGNMITSPDRPVQIVPGQHLLESISSPFPTESITHERVQTLLGANQLLNQADFFPSNDNAGGYIPYSNQVMPSGHIDVEMPMAFEEHDQTSTGLMAPMQLSQDHGNIVEASNNLFNLNTFFDMPVDSARAPTETGQLEPECLNAGSGEYFENFGNFDCDTATWNWGSGGYQR
jgi:hypothetical protein